MFFTAILKMEGEMLFKILRISTVEKCIQKNGKSHPLLPHLKVITAEGKVPAVTDDEIIVFVKIK